MILLALLAATAPVRLAGPPQLAELARIWTSGGEAALAEGSEADVTLSSDMPDAGGGFCLPVSVSAVAVAYNLLVPGDLRLTEEVLAAILEGRISRWSDPAVRAVNPAVTIPDLPIKLVLPPGDLGLVRSYAGVKGQLAGTRASSEVTTAEAIAGTEGALGVLDAGRARRDSLYLAALRNRDGAFVTPTQHSVSRAAVGVKLPDDLRASLAGARGIDSYPMASLIYACAARSPKAAAPFFRWVLHDGQKLVGPAGYAPLPGFMILLADQRLAAISP